MCIICRKRWMCLPPARPATLAAIVAITSAAAANWSRKLPKMSMRNHRRRSLLPGCVSTLAATTMPCVILSLCLCTFPARIILRYFRDVEMQVFCRHYANLFNARRPPKRIQFAPAWVIKVVDKEKGTARFYGVEPYLVREFCSFCFALLCHLCFMGHVHPLPVGYFRRDLITSITTIVALSALRTEIHRKHSRTSHTKRQTESSSLLTFKELGICTCIDICTTRLTMLTLGIADRFPWMPKLQYL